MVDQEGDGSGGISKEEFKAMLKRLSIKMSDHRIAEIFTSAQKHASGKDDDNPN